MCIFCLLGVTIAAGEARGVLFWAGPSVCALSSGAIVYPFLPNIRIRISEGVDWIQELAVLSAFWLPYIFIASRLRGEKLKSGLTLAIAIRSALFLPGVALLYHVHEWEESWGIQGSLFLALVMQPILVVTAVRAYKSLPIPTHGAPGPEQGGS